MKLFIASIMFTTLAAQAARIDDILTTRDACRQKAMDNMAVDQCDNTAMAASDVELNRIYNAIRSRLRSDGSATNQERLASLQAAQRAWITFRDANCRMIADQFLGGNGTIAMNKDCITNTTIARVKELAEVFQD